MSAGNDNANVWRIDRADARDASACADPINAVSHGYATSSLNDRGTARLRIHASTVVSHGMCDSTAWRASCANVANSTDRESVAKGCDDEKIGGAPPARNTHR